MAKKRTDIVFKEGCRLLKIEQYGEVAIVLFSYTHKETMRMQWYCFFDNAWYTNLVVREDGDNEKELANILLQNARASIDRIIHDKKVSQKKVSTSA